MSVLSKGRGEDLTDGEGIGDGAKILALIARYVNAQVLNNEW